MRQIETSALSRTATLWPPIKSAYGLVYQAAHILANQEEQTEAQVREAYLAWIKHMQKRKASLSLLSTAIDHFVEITESFASGLFHCYDVPDLPRTNNDLEHYIESPVLMSGEPRGDAMRFLAWWCVAPPV